MFKPQFFNTSDMNIPDSKGDDFYQYISKISLCKYEPENLAF